MGKGVERVAQDPCERHRSGGSSGAEKDPQRAPQPCTQDTLLHPCPPPPSPDSPGWSGLLSVSKCPVWGWAGDFRKSDGEELR